MAIEEVPAGELDVAHIGPPLSLLARGAVLLLGTVGMEMPGLQPLILGSLVEEERLTATGLGWACAAEFLAIAAAIGFAGTVLKPVRLRAIGAAAALILLIANVVGMAAAGQGVIWTRGLAGLGEGLLVWITACMIACSSRPAFWAAIFLVLQCSTQSFIAVMLSARGMFIYGANAGLAVLAVLSAAAVVVAPLAPSMLAEFRKEDGEKRTISPGGIAVLLPVFLVAAGVSGIFSYLGPLAADAQLPSSVVSVAVAATLAIGIVGSAAAALTATRLPHFPALCISLGAYLLVLALLATRGSPFNFIAASLLLGFFLVFFGPFFIAFAIETDPSRRSAVIVPGVQLFGAAAGPFACSFFVTDKGSSGILPLCALAFAVAFLMIAIIHIRQRRAAVAPDLAISVRKALIKSIGKQ